MCFLEFEFFGFLIDPFNLSRLLSRDVGHNLILNALQELFEIVSRIEAGLEYVEEYGLTLGCFKLGSDDFIFGDGGNDVD